MTKYFFHLREGATYTVDDIGVDLSNLDDVLFEATRCAREMVADSALEGRLIINHVFEIIDEHGTAIANFRFGDFLEEVTFPEASQASIDVNEKETIQYREVFENDAPPGAGG